MKSIGISGASKFYHNNNYAFFHLILQKTSCSFANLTTVCGTPGAAETGFSYTCLTEKNGSTRCHVRNVESVLSSYFMRIKTKLIQWIPYVALRLCIQKYILSDLIIKLPICFSFYLMFLIYNYSCSLLGRPNAIIP